MKHEEEERYTITLWWLLVDCWVKKRPDVAWDLLKDYSWIITKFLFMVLQSILFIFILAIISVTMPRNKR